MLLMPRTPHVVVPGVAHHLTQRGNNPKVYNRSIRQYREPTADSRQPRQRAAMQCTAWTFTRRRTSLRCYFQSNHPRAGGAGGVDDAFGGADGGEAGFGVDARLAAGAHGIKKIVDLKFERLALGDVE